MSVTNILEVAFSQQDDDSQMYNLLKRVIVRENFDSVSWQPSYEVPPSLGSVVLPTIPIFILYIKNIGDIDIGVEWTSQGSSTPPLPSPVSLTLLRPSAFLLLYNLDSGGAGMVTPGGPFPANVSSGINSLFLEASSIDPNANGVVEMFLAG